MRQESEVGKLKRLVRRYRRVTARLISEGEDYTSGEDCVFCSGYPGYVSAGDAEDGKVGHSSKCPTLKAAEIDLVAI